MDRRFSFEVMESKIYFPALVLSTIIILATAPVASARTGYLIITHDNFYNNILPLAHDKEQKEFLVVIKKTSDIAADPTVDDITNEIKKQYASQPDLRYVLLVGDITYIPAFWVVGLTATGIETYHTDHYYTTMDRKEVCGNGIDCLPDIALGRLPVNTTLEADTVVNKILSYYPASKNVLIFKGAASSTGDYTSDVLPGYEVDLNFNPNEIRTCNSDQGRYVVDAVNDGRVLAVYYGHGSTVDMGGFCQDHIGGLYNREFPVFLSGGCQTGRFDLELSGGGKSIGEELVLVENGAIAFVGGSDGSVNYPFQEYFLKALLISGVVGEMVNIAKRGHYADRPGTEYGEHYSRRTIEQYNLFGDPALIVKPDYDDDGYLMSEDCDDKNANLHPGAYEDCKDNIDNNCNGYIDEGNIYYYDRDHDSYGDRDQPLSTPLCSPPNDVEWSLDHTDCDDSHAMRNPGVREADYCRDGLDNDCDGKIDSGDPDCGGVLCNGENGEGKIYYYDGDHDTYGNNDQSTSILLCNPPNDLDWSLRNTDCDDSDARRSPGVLESNFCRDGLDNDCDGKIDRADPDCGEVVCKGDVDGGKIYYYDGDHDTYGNNDQSTSIYLCNPPNDLDWSLRNTDCDDSNAKKNPGVLESDYCRDRLDNDCDGRVDREDPDCK